MNKRNIVALCFFIFAIAITLYALTGLQKAQQEAGVLQEVLKLYCEEKTGEKVPAEYLIQEEGLVVNCLTKEKAGSKDNSSEK